MKAPHHFLCCQWHWILWRTALRWMLKEKCRVPVEFLKKMVSVVRHFQFSCGSNIIRGKYGGGFCFEQQAIHNQESRQCEDLWRVQGTRAFKEKYGADYFKTEKWNVGMHGIPLWIPQMQKLPFGTGDLWSPYEEALVVLCWLDESNSNAWCKN